MVAGESLADRLLVSPFVGMWLANALLLAAALMLAAWRRRGPLAPSGGEAVAVRG
jgi:lipopolysaccharide export LptBFGC system permease protein LptF